MQNLDFHGPEEFVFSVSFFNKERSKWAPIGEKKSPIARVRYSFPFVFLH